MKLSEMYEKRKAISTEIDTILAAKCTPETEARAAQLIDDQDGMDGEIRKQALRDRADAGGIVSTMVTGRPTGESKSEFRSWIAGGFRTNNNMEMRAVEKSELGGTTDIALTEFTRMMDRDSTIAGLATVTTVDSGAPIVMYRQDAQIAFVTATVAEAGSFISKDTTAQKVTFTPVKNGIVTTVSNEALRDMVWDVGADTIRQHAEFHAANWEAAHGHASYGSYSTAIFSKDGSVGNINVADTAATTAGIITIAEATNIVYGSGLKTGYLRNASWLLPNACWAATIAQSSTNIFPFGGGNFQSVARDGIGPIAQATFLGFPVYLSNAMATPVGMAGATAFAVFGDIARGYRIIAVNSVPFLADPYTSAANGQTRFLSETRRHGQILDRNAMVSITA